MKKKTRPAAAGAAKSRKTGVPKRKAAPQRTVRAALPRLQATPDDAKLTIRRLRGQLAAAQKRIEKLQASADTDFLLGILNRRGFERELNRSIAYINRYQ